jgi:hypothetical protein
LYIYKQVFEEKLCYSNIIQMKNALLLLLSLISLEGYSQDSTLFDSKFKFRDGVYTSCLELIKNSPRYFDRNFKIVANSKNGLGSIYCYDKVGNLIQITDSIFAAVSKSKLYVRFGNRFYNLILVGSISTFVIETVHNYSAGNSSTDNDLFFVDLNTGRIDRLNNINMDYIFKRDSLLYKDFLSISPSKRKKTLYSFILKYNQRHPIYIKTF